LPSRILEERSLIRTIASPLIGILMLASLAVATTTSALADPRDFTLVNQTDGIITHLYVSAVNTSSWEEDVLGRDILSPGESVDIYFTGGSDCVYDIKVLVLDGREGYLYGVNLCTTSTVTFS